MSAMAWLSPCVCLCLPWLPIHSIDDKWRFQVSSLSHILGWWPNNCIRPCPNQTKPTRGACRLWPSAFDDDDADGNPSTSPLTLQNMYECSTSSSICSIISIHPMHHAYMYYTVDTTAPQSSVNCHHRI
ncbi:hypothetical protein EX30DRAFT_135682 [Ascodesmis nigricans]|uniref:Secreted protein n=1 Tax=Ascodesmis nigricans TaxID=341454 RepID=A0A4V3SI34_9PEZI|nr:hypothetical protein EX30DRAFT_135682 [Ascodesmis nigricans]